LDWGRDNGMAPPLTNRASSDLSNSSAPTAINGFSPSRGPTPGLSGSPPTLPKSSKMRRNNSSTCSLDSLATHKSVALPNYADEAAVLTLEDVHVRTQLSNLMEDVRMDGDAPIVAPRDDKNVLLHSWQSLTNMFGQPGEPHGASQMQLPPPAVSVASPKAFAPPAGPMTAPAAIPGQAPVAGAPLGAPETLNALDIYESLKEPSAGGFDLSAMDTIDVEMSEVSDDLGDDLGEASLSSLHHVNLDELVAAANANADAQDLDDDL